MLPDFNSQGFLPPGDYDLTLTQLKASALVIGVDPENKDWDREWRSKLVDNLTVLVKQFWIVGITEIFINGSFVSDKDHPNDIDGYFCCEAGRLNLIQYQLNIIDPNQIWTWDPARRKPNQLKEMKIPMWHKYRVEFYPHYTDMVNIAGKDKFGNELEFPAFFRQFRDDGSPKGIVRIRDGGLNDPA